VAIDTELEQVAVLALNGAFNVPPYFNVGIAPRGVMIDASGRIFCRQPGF
jgi:hypothetical protein